MGKVKSRYASGWNDPRMPVFVRATGLEDIDTDVLRNLWLASFNARVISYDDIEAAGDEASNIVDELLKRKCATVKRRLQAVTSAVDTIYVLEREDADC